MGLVAAPITFVHMSDIHLTTPGQLAGGRDSPRRNGLLQRIQRLETPPAFIVISGDLSDDGSIASYEVLKQVLAESVAPGIPVLLALGNHDHRAHFRQVVLGETSPDPEARYCYSRLIDGLRVIVLDSVIPGEDGGVLGEAQLAWLAAELAQPAPRGHLIVLHHACRLAAPVHHAPAFIVRDVEALAAVIAPHAATVRGVLAGHSHQANAAPFAGTLYATAPAALCQLDFLAGEQYIPVSGSGLNLCRLDDNGLVVNPEFVDE
ncbi:MAG: metallophosphoesterase [Thermomicrobiales bacterium]